MSVSLHDLSEFLKQILGMAPPVDEGAEGVDFMYDCNGSCVHIGIYPEDIMTRSGVVEVAMIILTFYTKEGHPFNIKPYGNEFIVHTVSNLMTQTTWGAIRAEEVSEELTVLVLSRSILLTEEHLEPFEGDYEQSLLSGELHILHDEWLSLNEMLSFLCFDSGNLSDREMELLQFPEGSA
jgi:hypothetical protein